LANHKSAIKKARMSLRRNAINSKTMTEVRTLEKKLRKAIAGKNKDDSAKALVEFNSKLSKAAQKGRLKKETASRKVSRLSRLVATLA
jgi:small subunit ribosomal protein S20